MMFGLVAIIIGDNDLEQKAPYMKADWLLANYCIPFQMTFYHQGINSLRRLLNHLSWVFFFSLSLISIMFVAVGGVV